MSEWRKRAACLGVNPNVFSPAVQAKHAIQRAKDICSACPVKQACLEEHLRLPDRVIAGGMTYRERKALIRLRLKG